MPLNTHSPIEAEKSITLAKDKGAHDHWEAVKKYTGDERSFEQMQADKEEALMAARKFASQIDESDNIRASINAITVALATSGNNIGALEPGKAPAVAKKDLAGKVADALMKEAGIPTDPEAKLDKDQARKAAELKLEAHKLVDTAVNKIQEHLNNYAKIPEKVFNKEVNDRSKFPIAGERIDLGTGKAVVDDTNSGKISPDRFKKGSIKPEAIEADKAEGGGFPPL